MKHNNKDYFEEECNRKPMLKNIGGIRNFILKTTEKSKVSENLYFYLCTRLS